MTLRDIFLDIGDIFDFHYERNPNGTYRANTIIKQLVYPEIYLDDQFSENSICYYLQNDSISYQNVPNIRNSFTELMNNTIAHNRYPIIEFCELIDISRLYQYYQKLFLRLNEKKSIRASEFITSKLKEQPEFEAQLKTICSENYEYISWIIIYSMFKIELADCKFEAAVHLLTATKTAYRIATSGVYHKSSKILNKKHHFLTWLTIICVSLSILQIYLVFMPFISDKAKNLYSHNDFFYIVLLMISLLTFFIHFYRSKKLYIFSIIDTYHDNLNISDIEDVNFEKLCAKEEICIKPFENISSIHISRERLRNYLRYGLVVFIGIAIAVSILTKSFPILLTIILIYILAMTITDKLYGDYCVRTLYDAMSENGEKKKNPDRGIAKIYMSEFNKTHFNLKHEYYKSFVHIHSGNCYKHIFLITHNRLKNILLTSNMLWIYYNIILIVLMCCQLLFNQSFIVYMHVENESVLKIVISFYLLFLGIYSIITIIMMQPYYNNIAMLAYASSFAQKNDAWAEKTFLSLYSKGIIRDVDWMRGIFTYNVSLFEQGFMIEDIFPESDRMLYYHRHIVLKTTASIVCVLVYFVLLTLFVWHYKLASLFVPFTIIYIIANVVINQYVLRFWNKKRIIKNIQAI